MHLWRRKNYFCMVYRTINIFAKNIFQIFSCQFFERITISIDKGSLLETKHILELCYDEFPNCTSEEIQITFLVPLTKIYKIDRHDTFPSSFFWGGAGGDGLYIDKCMWTRFPFPHKIHKVNLYWFRFCSKRKLQSITFAMPHVHERMNR